MTNPKELLHHHVTGAIERGEAEAIVEIAAKRISVLDELRDGIDRGIRAMTISLDLIQKIADALDTSESGDALVEVVLDAHRAELQLANIIDMLEDKADYAEDTGPNDAMRFLNRIREDQP